MPPIYISGLVTLGVDRFRPQFQVAQVFQFIDIFTKLQGNHSLLFGYEYHRNRKLPRPASTPGIYASHRNLLNKSGFGFADFLMGDIASTIYNTPLAVHNFLPGHSFFAQDTWRIE